MIEKTIISILNINFNNISLSELQDKSVGVIFPVNVDMIMKAQKDVGFANIINTADVVVCDSQIIYMMSKFLKTPIKEKISGSDYFPSFCNYHRRNEDIKIFLLGSATQEIVEKAQRKINKKINRDIITDALSPSWGFENNELENKNIIELINKSSATVLAIGVGAPKQEKWIMQHKDKLKNIKIYLAIGATIDFEAGNIKRAPIWMSRLSLEWLYRLVLEPKRLWKRYLIDDMPFFFYILKQKFGLYKRRDII